MEQLIKQVKKDIKDYLNGKIERLPTGKDYSKKFNIYG
jgi:hypothetical protein